MFPQFIVLWIADLYQLDTLAIFLKFKVQSFANLIVQIGQICGLLFPEDNIC